MFVVFVRTSSAAAVVLCMLLMLLLLPPPYNEYCCCTNSCENRECVCFFMLGVLHSTMINVCAPWLYVISHSRPLFAYDILDPYGDARGRKRAGVSPPHRSPPCTLLSQSMIPYIVYTPLGLDRPRLRMATGSTWWCWTLLSWRQTRRRLRVRRRATSA